MLLDLLVLSLLSAILNKNKPADVPCTEPIAFFTKNKILRSLYDLILLFICSGAVISHQNCSYQALMNHLGLISNKDLFTLSRPVKNYSNPLKIEMRFEVKEILELKEVEQTFTSYIKFDLYWVNEFISWNESDFCGLETFLVPSEMLWKPDLHIIEIMEKDKSPRSPFLRILSSGNIKMNMDQVVHSSCRMQVYKLPFDTQTCNLTIKPFHLTVKEITLARTHREYKPLVMESAFEYVDLKIKEHYTSNRALQKQMITYTVILKRRSVLYVLNFILPVLVFFFLDYASFLLPDTGDKLSFKITILLAVTVLQLLLNDILPFAPKRIPLILVYCLGVVTLMMFSLLETIMIMFLLDRDEKSQKRGDNMEAEKKKENGKSVSGNFCSH
ncbi:hypothetical protein WMY93_020945 [Mugilogobius chulae]|uniref:Neurotransmitter-gated ion-channel ligand-binding domain-containing protein n=1 Tax=Mugilogobius chulae TaxID=88201 RepID=A0AAW0NAU5_9GOBI